MTIQENVSLAEHTTFGVGGPARYFAEAADEENVMQAVRWAEQRDVRLYVLGGGSNLLVPDQGFNGLVLLMTMGGVEQSGGTFVVGAGVSWDELVRRAVEADCAGIECLAGIPGSVGGTPVQNVGAYGQEVSETISSVRAYDRQTRNFVELTNADCRFRYRESLFNKDEPGRYIVTRVGFALRKGGEAQIKYADLKRRFGNSAKPKLSEVSRAVREIRKEKGMLLVEGDPDCRSAGSFFKNPIVPEPAVEQIAEVTGLSLQDVPHWPAGHGMAKLPAAWLLENAGFVKGFGTGPVRISSRHTLALTNRGGATFADITALQDEIVAGVERKFGVLLEREPVVLK